jgi:hypothetical protein
MPRLLDNLFSANPSNDKIDTSIDENLFTSLVVGYSKLIDRWIVVIIARFIISPMRNWTRESTPVKVFRLKAESVLGRPLQALHPACLIYLFRTCTLLLQSEKPNDKTPPTRLSPDDFSGESYQD